MHSLVLSFKCKDIFGALTPSLTVIRVDVCKDMGNTVLKFADSVLASVEITGTVPLSIKVHVLGKSIAVVDGDQQLDAVIMRLRHEVVVETV